MQRTAFSTRHAAHINVQTATAKLRRRKKNNCVFFIFQHTLQFGAKLFADEFIKYFQFKEH